MALTIRKKSIYNGFTSGFCAVIGFALCIFQIYCQLEFTDMVDVVFWVYLAIFPVFYILVLFGGSMLYSASNSSFIKVFVLNSFVLYLLIAVNLTFIFISFDEFVDNYIILGSIGVCSYLLSLVIYLQFLAGSDNAKEKEGKKPVNMLTV